MLINGINVTAQGFNPSEAELKNYAAYVKERVPDAEKIQVTLCPDGMVDVKYTKHEIPFERIRRITGYLVGTIDRWNDSKQAEERERVKHV